MRWSEGTVLQITGPAGLYTDRLGSVGYEQTKKQRKIKLVILQKAASLTPVKRDNPYNTYNSTQSP